MKFSQPVHAPEGLNTYAKVNRVRPVHMLITVFEALLALLGVIVLVLLVRYGSFEAAGRAIDGAVGCVHGHVTKLLGGKGDPAKDTHSI
ncbi:MULTISPECIES: hypothetical protein [Asticcacaulis]|uniref:hypothetical protein n=1 Tax=Asticcacaulis TaxID=76890 RepID=UPI001AE163CA|nr:MULTISPECIES: hypothetical protein [Asticcacaulis]MBP2160065.1 hypothetical protein [Asticcacaulis solisilvae]MDR6801110.1 hypothetical protein [Asticcacaulis sp. BE141]